MTLNSYYSHVSEYSLYECYANDPKRTSYSSTEEYIQASLDYNLKLLKECGNDVLSGDFKNFSEKINKDNKRIGIS